VNAVPEEILQHYAEYDESARITSGLGRLERVRTQEIVRRFLPTGSLEIADVGGGPGAHAQRSKPSRPSPG
jgi:hypothetical protein